VADDRVQWTCRNCGEQLTMLPKDPGFFRHPNSVTCWSSGNVVHAVDAVRADEIERLRAELSEAKRRASNAEFELNCLEQVRLRDNQYLIDRAENAERELAELRERIEKAPVGYLWLGKGKRVRLLVEESGS
jgi:DNA transposition AAA+ family ATPase